MVGLESTDFGGRVCRFLHTARCIFVYENLAFPSKVGPVQLAAKLAS